MRTVTATVLAPPVITVASTPPQDIPGGASAATLSAAAVFAWQEFIALNWPAKAGVRDSADTRQPFSAPGTQPLVWQTYRAKNEIFPGSNNAALPPHGYAAGAPGYGYNEPPRYVYNSGAVGTQDGQVLACANQPPVTTAAWINLDEVTQIGLDAMSAGVVPAAPTARNAAPQLIRFMAKANLAEYAYVAQNKYWYDGAGSPRKAATSNFLQAVATNTFPPAAPFISFPSGTFEVKAAFRPLTPAEKTGKRFYSTRVRYYERNAASNPCFREDDWGLIALHIIQKTPSAPAFIYATFEQADNLLTTVAGKTVAVEDENGNIVHASAPATTPALAYQDSTTAPNVRNVGAYCPVNADPHLFYRNGSQNTGLPSGGNICVNQRDRAIPAVVIAANAAAHQAIRDDASKNGLAASPWAYYKLVNVQAYPFNKTDIVSDPTSPRNAATYYQANVVVETNYTLQNFDGRISSTGAPTNFDETTGKPFQNAYVLGPNASLTSTHNMGGCMGCHGVAQVTKGADFSFILGATPTRGPETPDVANNNAQLKRRFNSLLRPVNQE